MRRIGIIFCGGCNPHYERRALADAVAKQLDGKYKLVYNTMNCEQLLYLSGCTSNCAYKYNPCSLPCTIVAGLSVNVQSVTAGEMLVTIIKNIDK